MPELKRLPIRFGIFEVDLEAGELRRQGLKVKLQQQPFQILAMLLESPGAVVTREELQKRLWPTDTFVDFDRGLNRATNRLRESLRDEADNPRFIETLPRRGYRFIAQVEKLDGGGSAPELASGQESSTPTNRSWPSLRFGRVSTRQGFSIAIIGLALLTLV
jgi:cholera toxin transcriptional activator